MRLHLAGVSGSDTVKRWGLSKGADRGVHAGDEVALLFLLPGQ